MGQDSISDAYQARLDADLQIVENARLSTMYANRNSKNIPQLVQIIKGQMLAESQQEAFMSPEDKKRQNGLSSHMFVEMAASRMSYNELVRYNEFVMQDSYSQQDLYSIESFLQQSYHNMDNAEKMWLGLSTLDSDGEKGPLTLRGERDAKLFKTELQKLLENSPDSIAGKLSARDIRQIENMPQSMKDELIDAIENNDNQKLKNMLMSDEVQQHLPKELQSKIIAKAKERHLEIEMAQNPNIEAQIRAELENALGSDIDLSDDEVLKNEIKNLSEKDKEMLLLKIDEYKESNNIKIDPKAITDAEKSAEQTRQQNEKSENEELSNMGLASLNDLDALFADSPAPEASRTASSSLIDSGNIVASNASTTGSAPSTTGDKTMDDKIKEATQGLNVELKDDPTKSVGDDLSSSMVASNIQQQAQTGASLA